MHDTERPCVSQELSFWEFLLEHLRKIPPSKEELFERKQLRH